MWDKMEKLFKRISIVDNIISMTHIEIVRYLKAMGQAEIYSDKIVNNSDTELWFETDGKTISVKPKQTEYI